MVKKIGKFFVYFFFFLAVLLFFTPKDVLYHQAEQKLNSLGIVISHEIIEDAGFTFKIRDAQLSVKKIPSVYIKNIKFSVFGFYNSIDVQQIELSKTLKSFAPTKIVFIKAQYTLLNPLHLIANAKGAFGTAEVDIDIVQKKLTLYLHPSKLMLKDYKSTLRNLKKLKTGGYIYEQAL